MSTLKVNSIIPVAGVPTGGGGGIVQVKHTTKSNTFTHAASSSFGDITGLSVDITPTSNTSKILIMLCVQFSSGGSGGSRVQFRLMRDSTPIAIGDEAGTRLRVSGGSETSGGGGNMKSATINFLDSPGTTSAVTYKVQAVAPDGNGFQLNKSVSDTNSTSYHRTASHITAMEVSA